LQCPLSRRSCLQPVNAYYRPHKGMKWRPAWELLHKGTGRLTILLGLTNISLGVFLAILPTGWVIAWFTILGVLVASATTMEVMLFFRRRAAAAMAAETAAVSKPSADGEGAESHAVALVAVDGSSGLVKASPPPVFLPGSASAVAGVNGHQGDYQGRSATGISPRGGGLPRQVWGSRGGGAGSSTAAYPHRM
jgi:hypothetical protein